MNDVKYKIVMKTPIGLRYGMMSFFSDDDRVNGTIDLLGHTEPFDGTVDSDGNCRISGHLVTLMRTIHYTAVGKVSPEEIELSLQGERSNFKITGTAVLESEVKA